eukprot:TRINITY_DN938_c0_g2_i1.p1 TRINITY_DN938_c0_g2~~TRINITY_DN938_c0_g2_i1.p1  ORF type:complete len:911 (-),score=318.10 TRINITY_DN938_c0_g2_i1:20-2752(-)
MSVRQNSIVHQMDELEEEENVSGSEDEEIEPLSSSEEEEEEEDEEDEEQEEPKLKYQRLGSSVIEILRKDAASCMAVHFKFLALGTHWGVVYILDFNGNEIKRFPSHSTTINELSVDAAGEYIASCSDDGRVVINSLYGTETIEYEHHRPVFSIALDPDFAKKPAKSFVIGGRAGHLVINSKGWFGRKDNIIHSGEGPIQTIKWSRSLIAWANDYGVKIFDCDTGQRITYIDRPKGSPRADLYRCNLCWENPTRLLIGWADSVKIGEIKERSPPASAVSAGDPSAALPDRYVQITALFQTDYYISGIAPFGEYLVMLAYLEEEDDEEETTGSRLSTSSNVSRGAAVRPEFRIITRNNKEISSDALTIHGFEQYKANNYRLGFMAEESMFYVVSPRDIVVARPRDLDDHITWLLERKRYETAIRVAESNESHLKEHKLVDIGEKYIEDLIVSEQYEKAAERCTKTLKRDASLWSKWIFTFVRLNQLRALVDFIPIGNPVLSDTVYEMVLGTFLTSQDPQDHVKFLTLVEDWPPSLYNPKNVIQLLKKRITEVSPGESIPLKDALAKLYTYAKKYDKTLKILLQLKRGRAFEFIEQYQLFDTIRDKVQLLMNYDPKRAVELLISNIERVPINEVVDQLQSFPILLHAYLHALFLKDPHAGMDYHEMQVSLYAEYDYPFLLTFLKQSSWLPLERAYQICEDKKYYPEMVFILGKMGNTKAGLKLLIEKIADVKKAIEFIEPQNDEELWDNLIDYSMKNPKFVSGLLEHIGAYVDPIRLIKRIPEGMEIIGLRDRLVKIVSDYNLQMSLREGCKNILKADCLDLTQKLNKGQRRPIRVEQENRCATCEGSLIGGGKDVIVFGCRHFYHQGCLRSTNETEGANTTDQTFYCFICQAQTKKRATAQRTTRRIAVNR